MKRMTLPPAIIVSHPDVRSGKPRVRGTRLTVQDVLGTLAAGGGIDAVLAAHPRLTREEVLACLSFAAELTGAEGVAWPLSPDPLPVPETEGVLDIWSTAAAPPVAGSVLPYRVVLAQKLVLCEDLVLDQAEPDPTRHPTPRRLDEQDQEPDPGR